MTWSEAIFRVLGTAAILAWIWRFLRDEHGRRRNRRLPPREDFQHCARSPYWSRDVWRR